MDISFEWANSAFRFKIQIFLCAVLQKTRAISLQSMPFRDSSLIARFFTEEFGLQSFVVNGVRSAKSRISPGLFQPMVPAELVQYYDSRKDLNRFSEIKAGSLLTSIPMNPFKTAMCMFVAEYLGKVLREHLENRALFEFSLTWICRLDELSSDFESAHLGFIWHSFSRLGITPESPEQLLESSAQIPEEFSEILLAFLLEESAFASCKVPSSIRQLLLDALVRYANQQMEGMGEIKSLAVLRQVFS